MIEGLFYIAIIIVKAPFRIFKYVVGNKLLFAGGLVALFALVIVPNFFTTAGVSPVPPIEISERQKSAPDFPVLATPTRVYRVVTYEDDGDYWLMTEFYDYNKEWTLRKQPVQIRKDRSQFVK